MEKLIESPLSKYPPDTLYQIRKIFNLENPDRMNEAIDILETWIKQQEHFESKQFERNYLETLIIACKGSLEVAKKKIDKLCTMRTLAPEFFGCELILGKDYQSCIYSPMPMLTPDYYKIFVAKMYPGVVSSEDHLNLVKDWIVSNEYFLRNSYSLGTILISDFRDTNMKDVLVSFNLTVARKYITMINEGFAMRLKALHYISNSKLVETFVACIKPLMPEKFARRIHIHSSLETLHKLIPKEYLCKELEGDVQSLVELHNLRVELVGSKEHIEYMKEVNKQKTDESRRIGGKIDFDFLPGTFRSLDVD